MSQKKLSCEMRVVFVLLSVIFLLSLILGKLFAIIGLLLTGYVAYKGTFFGADIIGPIVCKKSVIDALSNLLTEVKGSTGEVVDKAKEATEDVVERVKDKAEDVAEKVKEQSKKD